MKSVDVKYLSDDGVYQLIIKADVLNLFHSYRQDNKAKNEAGGQLFAKWNNQVMSISQATGVRDNDICSRFLFKPNIFALKKEIINNFREGLHYVGDWHTHPETVPSPSCDDIETIQSKFSKSKHELNYFVLIIVGTGDIDLFVSFYNNKEQIHLYLNK